MNIRRGLFRVLLVTALVVAGVGLLLLDDAYKTVPTGALLSYQWRVGAEQSYRFSIESQVRMRLSDSEPPSTIIQNLSGTLGLKVFSQQQERIRVGFQLASANYTLNGQTNEALRKNLEQPFVVVFDPTGRPDAFHFPEGLQQTERILLEESIRTFQLVLPGDRKATWTTSEEHATGRYLAHYQLGENSSIQKKKTLYTQLFHPEAKTDPDNSPKARFKESAGVLLLSNDKAWLHAAKIREKVSFIGGSGFISDAVMRAELEPFTDSPPQSLYTLFALPNEEALFLAEVSSAAAPVASSREEGSLPEQPELMPLEVLDDLLEQLNTVEKEGRIGLLKRIEQFLKEDPEIAFWLIETIKGDDSTGASDAWLIHLLERSGTPQAQEALALVASDPTYRHWNRIQAAVALGGVENPTEETLHALVDMTRTRYGAQEAELANTALLAIGSLGKTLDQTDPSRTDQVRQELTSALGQAKEPTEEAMVLKAMANMGDPAFDTSVRPYLEHDAPNVRSAAARALGRIRGEETLDLLADSLTVESDRHVRASIIIAMEQVGNVSDRAQYSVQSLVLEENDAGARYHMTKYLGDNLEGYPENRKILQLLALKDPSPQVRQYARNALLKADN